jgi:predicted esterase
MGGGRDVVGTPICPIHGAEDALAPVREIQEMASALHKSRAKVKVTILSGRDHFILDELQHPELYQWLLEQAPLR